METKNRNLENFLKISKLKSNIEIRKFLENLKIENKNQNLENFLKISNF